MSQAVTTPAAARRILRVGILTAMTRIDPRDAVDQVSGMVLDQIFEAPYTLDPGSSTVRPRLLEPLQPRGPLQYAAGVRQGIRFSDGTPLTADIVVRSLRGTKALANKATVEAKGDLVWFTLSAPNPRFDLFLTNGNCSIVLERGTELAGTGPFMFDGRADIRMLQIAKSIRLVRNPHHENGDGIDEVEFVVRPAETDGSPLAMVEALRRGEIDVTNALTMRDVTVHQIPGVTPVLQPGNSTGILFFNTERAVLTDRNVRRGIALALDVNDIASASFDRNPLAFVAPSLLPPMMGRSAGFPEKDPEQAKRLIAGSMLPLSRLTLLVPWAPRPYLPKPLAVATVIQKQLGELGIAVELRQPKTSEEFFNDLLRGNYDLALSGWIADTPDPADYYEALLWSKMAEGDNRTNDSRWKNADTDAALTRFRQTPTEENKRELDRIVREEAPLVPLIYGQAVMVHSRKIRNVSVSATGVLSLSSVTM
jgi:peptide/nickel transport system substrate-binding protein